MTLVSILPDLLNLAEVTFGPKTGAQKQAAVIDAIAQGLKDSGASSWVVSIMTALLKVAIPLLVAKYNADPNSIFFKGSAT